MRYLLFIVVATLLAAVSTLALAHGVDENTRSFLTNNSGVQLVPFVYIGAKHMFTGYDHILFLVGVLFFLQSFRDVLLYVTLFTVGHSATLLFGVLANVGINPFLIDAVIGFSVFYKGFDNLGGFTRCFGWRPNPKAMVLLFGLIHGFGLSSKLQAFQLPADGLLLNLLAFNVGVELGQFAALVLIFVFINAWRHTASFSRFSTLANTLLMAAGLTLAAYQLLGYWYH